MLLSADGETTTHHNLNTRTDSRYEFGNTIHHIQSPSSMLAQHQSVSSAHHSNLRSHSHSHNHSHNHSSYTHYHKQQVTQYLNMTFNFVM